ncbi:MAG: pyrophosphatase [Bdellovibrionota bacterium]
MNLKEIEQKLKQIIDGYSEKFAIKRDDDWYVLKIQEELGELTAAHLKLTQRGRVVDKSKDELEKNLREEIADVIAMTILFAQHKGIDIEKALQDKWFKHL